MSGRYQTAEELAVTIGGINARTVRTLRSQGLPAVKLGKAYLYDPEKALAWIAAREETSCQDQISGRGSSLSLGALPSTSSGTSAAGNVAVAQARQTAERLKRSSQHSYANDKSQNGQLVQLTRLATR